MGMTPLKFVSNFFLSDPCLCPAFLFLLFFSDKSSFRALYFSMVEEEHKEPTVYKLICAGPEERVVGVHIIGAGSDEVMQGFAVAVKMGGKYFYILILKLYNGLKNFFWVWFVIARKQDLDDTVAIHPTSAEGD